MADRIVMPASEQLFARKTTGLLRSWSTRDAFIYAAFSINLITLGLYSFSFAPFVPDGSLLWAVVLSGLYLALQAITYASLVAVMPRAGGDYVWMSRVLGGGIGFVLGAAGWWFILWHWVPIYANILVIEVASPLAAIAGAHGVADFFSSPTGVFVASMITALLASVLVSLGMKTYARIQRVCFYGGLAAMVVFFALLLFNSNADFVAAFDSGATETYGAPPGAYEKTLDVGLVVRTLEDRPFRSFGATLSLIPMIVFFNLWSNWGATLYGEVRDASDFRKNLLAMGGALLATTIVGAALIGLISKTIGLDFYYAANNAYWGGLEGNPIPVWPYPGMMAAFLLDSPLLRFALVAGLSLWFFGWVGTLFLSSTRVVFATAFDRILPEWAARTNKSGVPYAALALMLVPSIPLSYLYAYGEDFATYVLDAAIVIAITFLGSAVAAALLPWRRPEIYNASPIARHKIFGLPLITVSASLFAVFLVFCLWKWTVDDVYGVNDPKSALYMAALYLVGIAIYLSARFLRRRQGMDLKEVYGEIPAE